MELSGEKLNKAADYAEANFKLMWKLFSEEDRGRILTGMDEVSEDIRTIVRNSYIVDSSPIYWLEFPLIGNPCTDFSVGYYADELPEQIHIVGENLRDKKGYFEHFYKLLKENDKHNEVCLEFDVSAGEIKRPSYGSIPYMVDDFTISENKKRIIDNMTLIDQTDRIDEAISIYDKSPEYWKPYYQGVSDVRDNLPMRITWLLGDDCKQVYKEDLGQLKKDLESVGAAMPDTTIDQMLEVLKLEGTVELQMDLAKDGHVLSHIGMCASSDYYYQSADPMKTYEDYLKLAIKWGIADERYKCITPENKVFMIPYYDDEKGMIHKRITMGLYILKFKWSQNGIMPLKAYYFMKSNKMV